jgi:hypothetical protein
MIIRTQLDAQGADRRSSVHPFLAKRIPAACLACTSNSYFDGRTTLPEANVFYGFNKRFLGDG